MAVNQNSLVEKDILLSLAQLRLQLTTLDIEESIKTCRYLRIMALHNESSLLMYAKNASKIGIIEESLWAFEQLSNMYEANFGIDFLVNYYTFLNKTKNADIAAKHYIGKVLLNDRVNNKVFNGINDFIYKKYNIDFLDSLLFFLKDDSIEFSKQSLEKLGKLIINLRKLGLRYSFPLGKIIERNDKHFFINLFDIEDRLLFIDERNNLEENDDSYYNVEHSIGAIFSLFVSNRDIKSEKPYKGRKIGFFTDTLEMGGNERNAVFTAIESKHSEVYQSTFLLHYSDQEINNHWADIIHKNDLEVINIKGTPTVTNKSWVNFRIEFIDRVFKDCDVIIKDFTIQLKAAFIKLVELDLDHIHCFSSDTRCIIIGIAAALAGIPIISVNPGSMSPASRPKIRPEVEYLLYSGYKALLKIANVNLFFCSIAACVDYKAWLKQESSNKFNVNYVSIVTDNISDSTVSLDRMKLPRKKDNEVVIVGCFRFHPVKRPFLWIDIALYIAERHSNVTFYLVGDGALLKECKSKVNASAYADRFNFLGAIQDPSYVYDYSDITYMTSVSEGLGNVILEAESFGVVPVVPYVGGMPETIVHAKNGYVTELDEENPVAMIHYLEVLIENKELRNSCSEYAKYFVKANFGPNTMLNNVLSVKRNQVSILENLDYQHETIEQ